MNMDVKGNTLSWISKVAGKEKLYIAVLMILNIFQGICSIGIAVGLKLAVDRAVGKDGREFMMSIGMLIVIICVQIMTGAINKYLSEYVYATFENHFKKRLFAELLRRDYGTVTAKHSGEWLNRLTSDTVVVADGLTHILPGLSGMLIRLIGALVLIMIYLPKIAYIILPGGIVLLIITYCIRKIMKKLHKSVQEADGRLRVFLQENIGSMMVVKIFGKEDVSMQCAEGRMSDHKKAKMKKALLSDICNVGFAAVMNGVYILCVLYCGMGIIEGNISYGTLMAIMQLVGQVQTPLANITGVLPKYYAMVASGERLMEVEGYKEDLREIKDLRAVNSFYAYEFQSIGIKNGAFSYVSDHEEKVLENININVSKGEFVALTGASGCGKSTLLKLIMNLYPLDEGEMYMVSSGVSKPYEKCYKRLFAYVPQGNHLMSGTIGEIVAFFDKEQMKDTGKIEEALKIACAYDFVMELKDGIDTVLGERGCGLSEGQMQRIAIARAVFSECPILMLDEATSALDEHTEKEVLENLRRLTDKTVMIVTHRPAALEICDRRIEM